ncbi:MAG: carbohydrate ABC transporter permease, partial [Parvibaculaceae bacterium]
MPTTSTLPRSTRRLPSYVPWLLISPSIILLVALIAFPLIFALKSSFYFWNLQMSPTPMGFIGWDNYKMALSGGFFLGALYNTLLITVVGTAIEFVLGLAIALFLVHKLPGMNVTRALLIMPTT